MNVLAMNTYDAMNTVEGTKSVYDVINAVNPDVAVFPEAYGLERPAHMDAFSEILEDKGYVFCDTPYNDADGRNDRHSIVVLYRKEIEAASHEVIVLGGDTNRHTIKANLFDPKTKREITFIGKHLDNRREETRIPQAATARAHKIEGVPMIVAGDMNAIHYENWRARFLSALHPFTGYLPNVYPGEIVDNEIYRIFGRVCGTLDCLSAMAIGETMKTFEAIGLRDLDIKRQPTMHSFLPMFQLDHIFATPEFVAPDGVQVLARNPVSDHRGITATLTFKR